MVFVHLGNKCLIVYVLKKTKQVKKQKQNRLLWFDPRGLVKVSRRRAFKLVWFGSLNPATLAGQTKWPLVYVVSSKEEAHGTRMGTTTRKSARHALEDSTKEGRIQQKEDVETKADKNQTDHVSS